MDEIYVNLEAEEIDDKMKSEIVRYVNENKEFQIEDDEDDMKLQITEENDCMILTQIGGKEYTQEEFFSFAFNLGRYMAERNWGKFVDFFYTNEDIEQFAIALRKYQSENTHSLKKINTIRLYKNPTKELWEIEIDEAVTKFLNSRWVLLPGTFNLKFILFVNAPIHLGGLNSTLDFEDLEDIYRSYHRLRNK